MNLIFTLITVILIWSLVGFHPATRSVQSTPADNTRKRVWQYIEKERRLILGKRMYEGRAKRFVQWPIKTRQMQISHFILFISFKKVSFVRYTYLKWFQPLPNTIFVVRFRDTLQTLLNSGDHCITTAIFSPRQLPFQFWTQKKIIRCQV